MDDILDSLNSFSVTVQQNCVHAEHPRFSQFKSKQSKSCQEERRKAVLAARKKARYDLLNHVRFVEHGNPEDEDATLGATSQDAEDMQGIEECYQKPKQYNGFLMYSEWLVDVPEDFASMYIALPVPVGKRCLVLATNGYTRMFGRNGNCLEEFNSVLPGGSRLTVKKGYAMLDCIANYDDNTFYVIDMIAWMNQSMMQCETPFRFEWIRSRLSESEHDFTQVTDHNDYKFVSVKHYVCDSEGLQSIFTKPLCFEPEMDGILFYHQETHYTHGPTPLVGWLRPFMMPEILGVSVPDQYLADKPEKYVNLTQHIEYGKQARGMRLERNAQLKEQNKKQKQEKQQANLKNRVTKTKQKAMDCDTLSASCLSDDTAADDDDDTCTAAAAEGVTDDKMQESQDVAEMEESVQ